MTSSTDLSMTVQLPAELAARLDQLVKSARRNKTSITVTALRDYLDAEALQIHDIEQGVAEADRGEFASEGEVHAFFAKYSVQHVARRWPRRL